MFIRLNELKGRKADQGKRVTLDDIALGTGINRATIDNISRGLIKEIRTEYIDALCAYFDVSPGELIEIEPVELPLSLNIRPDRHGARAGTKTKQQASSSAEHPLPAKLNVLPNAMFAMPEVPALTSQQQQAEAQRRAAPLDQANDVERRKRKVEARQTETTRLSRVTRLDEED